MSQIEVLPVEMWMKEGKFWPSRFVSKEILEVFFQAKEDEIVTDNRVYSDYKQISLVIETYRRLFNKNNPVKKLQTRIFKETEGWRWYARVVDKQRKIINY